jgi:hypothetical protein
VEWIARRRKRSAEETKTRDKRHRADRWRTLASYYIVNLTVKGGVDVTIA